MKKNILIIAILVLSVNVFPQLKDEKSNINEEQVNFITSQPNQEDSTESEISEIARELNNSGVKKALVEHNLEAAAELFRKAIESDSRCLMCQYNLGMALIKSAKYEESIKIFNKIVPLKPTFSKALAGLGEAYYKKKLFKEEALAPTKKQLC